MDAERRLPQDAGGECQCLAQCWFHTGDAFRRDKEGNFYFCDRIKDAIRRRGENISSFEVEDYLHEHSDVLECAAVPVRDGDPNDEEVKVMV